jgi:hypothetical protein
MAHPREERAQRAEQAGKEEVAPCTPFVSVVFNFDPAFSLRTPDPRK